MTYTEVALGHNNSAGLASVLIQPDYDGLQYPREIYTGDNDVLRDGWPFVELRYPDILLASGWWAILGQFGLQTAKTALVTVRLMDEDKVNRTVYNGRAVKKEYGQVIRHDLCWYKSPRIDLITLEAL